MGWWVESNQRPSFPRQAGAGSTASLDETALEQSRRVLQAKGDSRPGRPERAWERGRIRNLSLSLNLSGKQSLVEALG